MNENCKLSKEEDNLVSEINQIIMHNTLKARKESSDSCIPQEYKNPNQIEADDESEKEKSEIIENLETAIKEIRNTKRFLIETKSEIENSFSKLNLILESRNELSSTLKDFNNSSKRIISEKEK